MKKIGVGMIGARPTRAGWAGAAHLNAIRLLLEFGLRAVDNASGESNEVMGMMIGRRIAAAQSDDGADAGGVCPCSQAFCFVHAVPSGHSLKTILPASNAMNSMPTTARPR